MQAHCGIQAVHNKCREVMKHNKHCVDKVSDNELLCMLKKGVIVDGNKKFWLDGKHHMCAELFAKALNIAWGSNCAHWVYKSEKLSCGACIEVAELREVNWLEVKGSFNAKMLTPNTEYEVLYDVEMKPCAEGFSCHPVRISLTDTKGCKTENSKCLDQFKGKGWKQISIGKFRSPSECECESKSKIEFSLHETNAQIKKGLVVRGVIIRPAAKCGC
ncbi:hypothetical protein V2J09_001836 [Rumex salicifolius]